MRRRKNVQDQIREREAKVLAIAQSYAHLPKPIRECLSENGFNPDTHTLVAFSELPPCCDRGYVGMFVSVDLRFIEFEITLTSDGSRCERVDRWSDVTDQTEVDVHKPGIGKTFGAVALEVHAMIRQGSAVNLGS